LRPSRQVRRQWGSIWGLSVLVVLSTGEKIAAPKRKAKRRAHLRRAHKSLSRKQ